MVIFFFKLNEYKSLSFHNLLVSPKKVLCSVKRRLEGDEHHQAEQRRVVNCWSYFALWQKRADLFSLCPSDLNPLTATCRRCLHDHPAETGFHTALTHISGFPVEASLVTVGWQTLLLFFFVCELLRHCGMCFITHSSFRAGTLHRTPGRLWPAMHCLCVCVRVCVRVHACEFTQVTLVNAAVCRFSRFREKATKL